MNRFGFTRLRSSGLRRGFTLIEITLVIAILAILIGVVIPLYNEFQIRSDLNLATEQATQGLGRARLLSQTGKLDSVWGFYVPSGTLYKGTSYLTRDPAYDEVYPMPSNIKTSGLLQVSYGKLEGRPSATGSMTLTSITGEERNILITIDTSGVAVNQTDKITICHSPLSNPNTLVISDNAWPAHLAHGDTLGACPGGAASSAVSSIAASSSAVSSVSGTCTQRFSVAADGTIITTSTVNVTFKAIGSQITYGTGGPAINVYVAYSSDGGKKYANLFGGTNIEGAADGAYIQTVSGLVSGSKVVTSFQGYYKNKGWLTFDQTFTSADKTGHVLMLRDGDSLPNYPAFSGQQNLKLYLKPYVNAQNKISIGQYDVLYLVELGTIGTPMPATADFQDAVLLETFNQPAGACS